VSNYLCLTAYSVAHAGHGRTVRDKDFGKVEWPAVDMTQAKALAEKLSRSDNDSRYVICHNARQIQWWHRGVPVPR
jgi:hypothetical protein